MMLTQVLVPFWKSQQGDTHTPYRYVLFVLGDACVVHGHFFVDGDSCSCQVLAL